MKALSIVGWALVLILPAWSATQTLHTNLHATLPKVAQKRLIYKKIDPSKLKIVIPKAEEAKKPEGPDPARWIDLSDYLEDPTQLEAIEEMVGWDPHRIYQDKAAPNHFYYLPSRLLLTYDETGYGLYVQYNASGEATDASVLLTAMMRAPFKSGDAVLLKKILRSILGLDKKVKLHIHAVSPLRIEANLENLSHTLQIPKERIALQLPGSLRDSMTLSLRLTPDETEEVLALIANAGIGGNVAIGLDEETETTVPFRIRYSEFSGNPIPEIRQWIRGEVIEHVTNVTPFPIRLNALEGFVDSREGPRLVIKRFKKTSPIQPKEQRGVRLPPVQKVFGKKPILAWFGMEIDTSCEPCIKKIDEEVRSGIALNPLETLTFEAIPNVFEKYGIYKIRIKVATPYFTQKANRIATKEIELTPEKKRDETLRIYMPKKPKRPDPLLFKYRITIIFESGESVQGEWHKSRETALYIGTRQLEPILSKEK